jgi:hypothetical protein
MNTRSALEMLNEKVNQIWQNIYGEVNTAVTVL